MDPLVSIIIPSHNAGKWIFATLQSVFSQTFKDFEILVVDDGSTDDSSYILSEINDRRLRLLKNESSERSAAKSRNLGLYASRGVFVKFLDADDLLSGNCLELQVSALDNNNKALAYSEWARFYNDPGEANFTKRPGWHNSKPVDWLVETWTDTEPMMQCGQFLIPRTILNITGGWDERLSLIDDFEFFTRVILASSGIQFSQGARLFYRSGIPGSISSQKSEAAWRSAHLSTTLAVSHLLKAEDSPRCRKIAAAMMQELVYSMYPSCPELLEILNLRIKDLGGSEHSCKGGPLFKILSQLIGWKSVKKLQLVKHRVVDSYRFLRKQ